VCNRIAKGQFTFDGYTYRLATNNAPNHLHGGGPRSLDKVRWQAEVVGDKTNPGVRFTYTSPDGEEGYPGNLTIAVTYSLFPVPDAGALTVHFEATTDKATPVNLTNHAYWNLTGAGAPTVLDHVLQLAASQYTPTDDTLIPTGKLADVAATPLDFRKPQPLGFRIDDLTATAAKGIDHNFVLDANAGGDDVARLGSPQSGRWLEIRTSEPGLQVYTGNFLFGQTGKGGRTYAHRSAVCLETQHFPDSINQPSFPSTVLQPGQKFTSSTTFTFGVD
jgi:aldose 1-epimerase